MAKLIIKHFQNKKLAPYKGVKGDIRPIYIRIQINRDTFNVRSKLWDAVVNDNIADYGFNSQFLWGYKKEDTSNSGFKIEHKIPLEFYFTEPVYSELCAYEADAINRIRQYCIGKENFTTHELIGYYKYFGQDAISLISEGILKKFISSNIFSIDFNSILSSLITSYNPKRVMLFLDECGFQKPSYKTEEEKLKEKLKEKLVPRINTERIDIHFHFMVEWLEDLIRLWTEKSIVLNHKYDPKLLSSSLEDINKFGYNIYYFPIIYLFNGLLENSSLGKRDELFSITNYLPKENGTGLIGDDFIKSVKAIDKEQVFIKIVKIEKEKSKSIKQ